MPDTPQPGATHFAQSSGPALRTFFRMAEQWKLRVAEQRKLLGDPPESTFYKWKRQREGALARDTIERISYLLGIWKSLQILFPDPVRAVGAGTHVVRQRR